MELHWLFFFAVLPCCKFSSGMLFSELFLSHHCSFPGFSLPAEQLEFEKISPQCTNLLFSESENLTPLSWI